MSLPQKDVSKPWGLQEVKGVIYEGWEEGGGREERKIATLLESLWAPDLKVLFQILIYRHQLNLMGRQEMPVLHRRKWSCRHCLMPGVTLTAADRTRLSACLTFHCCFTQDTPWPTHQGIHSDAHLPGHLHRLPGSLLENMEGKHKSVPTWREGKCLRDPAGLSPPNPQLQAPASCPPQLLCAVIPSAYNTVPVPWTPTQIPPSPPLRFLLRCLLHRKGFQDHPL